MGPLTDGELDDLLAPTKLSLTDQWKRERALFDARETLRAVDSLLFSLSLRLSESELDNEGLEVDIVRARLHTCMDNVRPVRAPIAGEAA